MSVITIELTPRAVLILQNFDRLPVTMLQAIVRGMDEANQVVWSRIQKARLTGAGPFPVEENRLGQRTSEYTRRFIPIAPVIHGATVTAALSAGVRYAAVHEFGFDGTVDVPAHSRKVSVHRLEGKRISGPDMRRLGLVTKSGKPRAAVKTASSTQNVRAFKRHMRIPARAPITTGVRENMDVYSRLVSDAIVQEFNRGNVNE